MPMEGSDHGSRATPTTSSAADFGEPRPESSPPTDQSSPDATSESEAKSEAHTITPEITTWISATPPEGEKSPTPPPPLTTYAPPPTGKDIAE